MRPLLAADLSPHHSCPPLFPPDTSVPWLHLRSPSRTIFSHRRVLRCLALLLGTPSSSIAYGLTHENPPNLGFYVTTLMSSTLNILFPATAALPVPFTQTYFLFFHTVFVTGTGVLAPLRREIKRVSEIVL